MSNELQAYSQSGLTLYAVLVSAVGQFWNGSAFEAYDGPSWTDYDVALTEAGAGIYLGDMPAVAAGVYSYVVYEQAGASPATTDDLRGTGSIEWDGSAVQALSSVETLVDDLESRLTAARAGYLDNLNTGVMIRGYTDGSVSTYFKQFTMPGSETGLTTVTPGSTGWARYAGAILMGNAIGAYRILSATDTTLTLDRALLVGGGSCVIIPDSIAEIAALNNLSAAQVWQYVIETLTAEQIMRISLAVLSGKSDGGATTTIHFRDYADTINRVTATVDDDGNRTAITLIST